MPRLSERDKTRVAALAAGQGVKWSYDSATGYSTHRHEEVITAVRTREGGVAALVLVIEARHKGVGGEDGIIADVARRALPRLRTKARNGRDFSAGRKKRPKSGR